MFKIKNAAIGEKIGLYLWQRNSHGGCLAFQPAQNGV